MSVLTMRPKHWASWDFHVEDASGTLALIDVAAWKEKGILTVRNDDYRVFREGALGDFLLERHGSVLARATKPSMFRSSFELAFNDRHFTLMKASLWSRRFVVLAGEREVGSLQPQGIFTRVSTIDLPDEWPAHIKVFATWLVIILWKREANAGGG